MRSEELAHANSAEKDYLRIEYDNLSKQLGEL